MNYGTVAINEWAAIGYIIPQLPWGGFPGNRDNDIQSGQSVVHNSMLFESPLKGVVNTNLEYLDLLTRLGSLLTKRQEDYLGI